jgi:hypothetical protein
MIAVDKYFYGFSEQVKVINNSIETGSQQKYNNFHHFLFHEAYQEQAKIVTNFCEGYI